ncbi:dihydrodipicolinate synthase family protein [Candidatus Sumerlaeota bacterium]|nr:dihydrodipicolinate synthase family protein [Candidatus Sumerlaeota bacterium]
MQFHGIIIPVITPFHEDYSIDEESYAGMIERLIKLGAHAIVIGGTTGENYALTKDERIRQFKFASEVIKKRVPWLAGVNDLRTEDVCVYSVAAREAGADALLLGVPPYSVPTDQELALHALKVDREANMPIMLYNYPGRSAASFGEDFLRRVGRSANFIAIKESSGDINRVHMIAREFPHMQLSCGADDQALEFFAWGAQSWVCAAANFFARECIYFWETCVVKQDFATGRRIMKAMLPLMTVLERGGKFVQCVKYACELDGMPAGKTVRMPLRPLKKELQREMRDTIKTTRTAIWNIAEGK